MNRWRSSWTILLVVSAIVMFASESLSAEVLRKTEMVSGVNVSYAVVLPNGYDANKAYPGVLAFPGGPQNLATLEGTLQGNWREQAEQRGYIVVVPAAPRGQLFYEDGDKIFPAFLTKILHDYKILDNKFHIAGVSNGGKSAFHLAVIYPQYFWSVTGLPGYLMDPTEERIHAISNLCINMYVGQMDNMFMDRVLDTVSKLRAQGLKVNFSIEQGEGHVMKTIEGDGAGRLFDQFEAARHQGCQKAADNPGPSAQQR